VSGGRRLIAVAACGLVALCLFASPAAANTITVSTTTDNVPGSLRDAVEKVEPGGTVVVPAGTYPLTVEQLFINKSLSIVGAGAASTTITPNHGSRALLVSGKGIAVTVSGVTITQGLVSEPGAEADGGAIADFEGSVTVEHSVISNNSASADGKTGESGGEAKGGAIFATGPLQLVDVTLTGNRATARGGEGESGGIAEGGGVWSSGGATLSAVTFVEDLAVADGGKGPSPSVLQTGGTAKGGGAFITAGSGPTVSLTDTAVSGSWASAPGGFGGAGGIAQGGGLAVVLNGPSAPPLSVSSLTASGNFASAGGGGLGAGGIGQGGGIFAIVKAASSIVNATVVANQASGEGEPKGDGEGGGVWSSGEAGALTILSSTIDGNFAQAPPLGGGGGNLQALEPVKLRDTIVSGGSGPAGRQNCAGTIESLGNNLEDRDECGFHAPGDITGSNPSLGQLRSNGGPLLTQAPGQFSAALDAGAACPATDERGLARPQGSACDIGAYELAPPSVVTGAASAVGESSATLSGTDANPDLLAGSGFFQLGTTTAYTNGFSASASIGAGVIANPFSVTVTGLKPATTYHYRAIATNPSGEAIGADATFTTKARPGGSGKVVLSGLALSPSHLRSQHGRGASLAKSRGAKLSYELNSAAKTTLRVQRIRNGFRAGSRCQARRPHHHRGKLRRCALVNTVGSFSHQDGAGRVTLRFTGRVGGRPLAIGSYRLRAVARNAAGRSSAAVAIPFSVIR
jgi:hypothetical protein